MFDGLRRGLEQMPFRSRTNAIQKQINAVLYHAYRMNALREWVFLSRVTCCGNLECKRQHERNGKDD